MKKLTIFLATATVMATGAMAQAAETGGVWLAAGQLKPAARQALQNAVAAARAKNPAIFDAIGEVRGCTLAGYSQTRLGAPECAREMRLFKTDALLPLLSALALQEPRAQSGHVPYATAEEKLAFAQAALETVGLMRDARAHDVIHAAFAAAANPLSAKLAAEAAGRLGGDADLAMLEGAARTGSKQTAAISGLGECKRIESAKLLAKLLADPGQKAMHAAIANALGRAASAWAWQAIVRKAPAKGAESLDVRTVAAQALAEGLLAATDADTVEELTIGLQMTEHPQTAAILADVRARAGKDAAVRIDAAVMRYDHYLKR